MTVDPVILKRIKMLHAKAESLKEAGPEYEQEALTFAAKAAQMLEAHNVSMTDVEYALQQENEPIKFHFLNPEDFGMPAKKRTARWWELLAVTVVEAHGCDLIFRKHHNGISIIGRRTSRAVAEYVLVTLWKDAERLADKAYVKAFYKAKDEGDVTAARGFRVSFLEGFVYRIHARYKAEQTQRDREYAEQGRQHALIRLSSEKALLKQAADEIKKAAGAESYAGAAQRGDNILGFAAGLEAGDKVNIRGTGLKPGAPAAKRLGDGQLPASEAT